MSMTDANHAGNNKMQTMAALSMDNLFLQSLMTQQANGESGAKGPPGLSMTPTMSGLLQALRRRWFFAVVAAATAAAATVFAVFLIIPPKYPASIRFRVTAKQGGPEDVEFPIYKANVEWLVRSPQVLHAALNEKLPDGREVKDLELIKSQGAGAVAWLDRSLKTEYVLNAPEILRVSLTAEDAKEGAEILNAIAAAFRNECVEMERAKRQQRLIELRSSKERIESELRVQRLNLQKLIENLDAKDRETMNVERNLWVNKLAATEMARRNNDEEIIKSENEEISLKAKLKVIDSFKVPLGFLIECYHKDPTIIDLEKKSAELDTIIADIYSKYNEPYATRNATPRRHEKIRIRQAKEKREAEMLPELEKSWRLQEQDNMLARLDVVHELVQQHKTRKEAIYKECHDLERKISESPGSNKPQVILAKEEHIEVLRKGLDQAALKIGEVELEVTASRVTPLEQAYPAVEKDISKQIKYAGAGGFGMFGLVLFGIAFLEFRSRKISLAEEVSHGLGLKVIGTIPALGPNSRNGSARSEAQQQLWQNQLHESVDAIRTVLLHCARSEPLRIVMVTSANCGEGKTTLATQLAASLARAWKRTLIIDGDLRRPATHKLFDMPQEPGLSEVLRGEVEVADAIRATAFSRLWLLPAGNGDSHAIQALAQESVGAIFASLKQQYDFIIVDSPPVMPVTDSLLLGQHVDGVIFSILRDVSRAPAIYAAQQKLAPLHVHTLGAVVLGTQPDYANKNYRTVMTAK